MFFDILILIIIIACAVFGFHNGLLISLSRLGGWIGAVIVAFLFHKDVGAWLIEHTSFYERITERTLKVCDGFVANAQSTSDNAVAKLGESLAAEAADKIAAHVWTIVVFVGVILGIKLILFVLTLFLSKKYHDGFIGGIDGFVGLLFGLFQAIVAILVVFALILPIAYTTSVKTHDFIDREMDKSIVAELIYENNPLLEVIDGFLPTSLRPEKWIERADTGYTPKDWLTPDEKTAQTNID
ncbi:hypothetical protein AGMMS49983_22320 [Clostridia bacterium]|nr:hypothetical protein AGMMS49983_22320 [Clostridia bacterium]